MKSVIYHKDNQNKMFNKNFNFSLHVKKFFFFGIIALFQINPIKANQNAHHIECQSKIMSDKPVFGKCVTIKDCQESRGNYQLQPDIDLCGISSENAPLVCCTNQRPVELNQRISITKCMEYNNGIAKTGPKCILANPLIMGGEKSHIGEHPHFALIGWKQLSSRNKINFNCGGTLISDRFVLTAAHCLMHQGQRPSVVRLGEYDLSRDDETQHIDFGIDFIKRHKDYKFYNDIALIRLDRQVEFSVNIRPACLWNRDEIDDVSKALAIGFGYTDYLGDSSKVMQQVTLDIIDQTKCNGLVTHSRRLKYGIMDTQICAAVLTGGKDTCPGDSGGPLQISFNSDPCVKYVIGVTSLGKMCGVKNSPGIYTKVSKYLDWIEEIVWNGNDE